MANDRVMVGDVEIVAEEMPPRGASPGRGRVIEPSDVLAAMDELGADSVRLFVGHHTSSASSLNSYAAKDGVPVRFCSRNSRIVDGKRVCDVYAVRKDADE